MKLFSALLLILTPQVLGYGESCHYDDSDKYGDVKGVCGSPEECLGDAFGYWVKNRCPGGNSNRCCITRTCKANGKSGYCTTTSNCRNNPYLKGKSVAGHCPGPNDVQCCI